MSKRRVVVTGLGLVSPIGLLNGGHSLVNVALHLVGLHTLWPGSFTSINGVFWTIGLEIQFYLAYLLLAHRPATPLKGFALMVMAVAAYAAASFAFPSPSPWREVGQAFVLVTLWQWYLGAVLADLYVRHADRFAAASAPAAWTVRLLAATALIALGLGDPVVTHVHPTYWLLPLAAAMAVIGALMGPARARPRLSLTSELGKASYSLYLLHPAVLGLTELAARAWSWPLWLSTLVAIIGAVAVALIAYRVIERPFMAKPSKRLDTTATAAAE